MPEKEVKRASRNRNPRDAHPRTCRGKRLTGTSLTSPPFSQRAHRSLRSLPPIPRIFDYSICNRSKSLGVRGGKDSIEGFQFRCEQTILQRSTIFAHRNCQHVRQGLNPRVTISRDFFGYFLSRKESNTMKLRHYRLFCIGE